VIQPLRALPAHVRSRLQQALSTSMLAPPYTTAAVRSALGAGVDDLAAIRDALTALDARGVSAPAIALVLDASAPSGIARPDLVWSGPTAPGLHTRNTRQVYEELIATAQRSIWISTFAYFDGQHAFRSLAERMTARRGLQVRIMLNIQRRHGDATLADQLVAEFAHRFWSKDWPGELKPFVYYDPRSLEVDGPEGVLHAKAIVVDDRAALVTSANLTEAAFDRNIEVGILTRDQLLAASLARHFRVLIDRGLLRLLPPVSVGSSAGP
jgi:phosphatidylserine/phosphatidylglycerophosphate/cardiolipin synthase-like enzyme